MISLTARERAVADRIARLKKESGSHSPNIFTLADRIRELNIRIDCCFLSNPYATDLFLSYLKRELLSTNKLRDVLEFYPSQNQAIAHNLAKSLGVPSEKLFIGNGATEIIQAILHNFPGRRVMVNIPTFSSYYEFIKPGVRVIFNKLRKSNDYQLDPAEFLASVRRHKPDTVVIINPNNPNGGYLPLAEIRKLLSKLRHLDNVIVDESFIHFAHEGRSYALHTAMDLISSFDNLVVVKSMSKDFGVAGIRVGFGVMSEKKVAALLKTGYLWNVSGLAEYFLNLYVRKDFLSQYEKTRLRSIHETEEFFDALGRIPAIRVYPSMANFALLELIDGSSAKDFEAKLLIKHGIYVRNCSDKIGLDGEFVRLASRKKKENAIVIDAIHDVFR